MHARHDASETPALDTRVQVGVALLRLFVEAAGAGPGADAMGPWRAWLGSTGLPASPPPQAVAPWLVGADDAEWRLALPHVISAVADRCGAILGGDATDRLLLEAYETLARVHRGDPGLAFAVHLLPERLLQAGEAALLEQIRDLERLREAEAAGRALMQAVLNAAATGIIVTNEEGLIEHANAEAAALFGFPEGGLQGVDATTLMPPRFRTAHLAGVARTHGNEGGDTPRMRPLRVTGLRRDGTEFPLELTQRTLRLPDGRRVHTAGLRDLTETLAAQARMALTDRLVSVGTLAAGAAHEINNPLAYVSMNVEFVRDVLRDAEFGAPLPAAGELAEALDQALDGTQRIQRIIRALRTLARSGGTPEGGLDVHSPLDTALHLTDNELRHRAQLVRRFGPAALVAGDEARLCQVFSNLLLNAAQSISSGAATEHFVEVVTAPLPGGGARVTIRDSGHGIAPEHSHRVFDPFFTTRQPGQGLGLGLTVCHAIISQLGGQLTLTPDPEGGTLATVELPPPNVAGPSDERASSQAADDDLRALSVMIVDDEPLVIAALSRSLAEHRVVGEVSARQALARLGAGEHFDAILCDVMMPDMGGQAFWEQLGFVRPEARARVVFMTGGAFSGDAAQFLSTVSRPCLSKPLDMSELRALLQQAAR